MGRANAIVEIAEAIAIDRVIKSAIGKAKRKVAITESNFLPFVERR
jgi:hypothetical protein